MSNYVLSAEADSDLINIYRFSYEKFGESRADAYLFGLEEKFHLIAKNKEIGRNITHIRNGYFRYDYISHSIFYKFDSSNAIFIVRILHNAMDQESHL